jgi:DNA-binding transcriptional ArsR family regulator
MKMSDAIAVLDALAQESRLQIFRYLIQVGPPGASAGTIGDHLRVHAATLSFHLSALRHAGLVLSRRESRSIIYTANFARMNDLLSYLMQNCCQGDSRPASAGRLEIHAT